MAKLSLMARLGLDISNYQANMQKARNNSDMIGQGMKRLGGMIAGAFSIGVIANFAKASFEAYQQQMEAEARLQDAFKGRQDIMKRLAEDAGDLQNTTLFADDDIINAQAMFATIGLGEDAIRKLLPLITDLAARYGKTLPDAAEMVKLAITGSGKAMKQYGFEIEGAAGSGERFNSVLGQLNEKVKGQAEAIAQLDTSTFKRLGVAWDEFMETVGGSLAGPLSRILDYFSKDLPAAFAYIGNGFKLPGKESNESEIDKGMSAYSKADEKGRKAMVDSWQTTLELMKANYNQALLNEGVQSKAAIYYQKNIRDIETLISKTSQYNSEQSITIKQTEEDIEAQRKLYREKQKALSVSGMADTYNRDTGIDANVKEGLTQILETQIETNRQAAILPGLVERTTKSMEQLGITGNAQLSLLSAQFEDINLQFKGIMEDTFSFQNIFLQMVDENITSLAEFGKAIYNTSRQILAAYLAESIGAAVKSALASVPFPLNLAAAAVAAGAAGALFNTLVPKLADGGVAYGQTTAIVGEYAGVRSNPEVIAPLDKLKGMIGGGDTVNVRGRLSGSDILISSERYDKLRTRLRGF